MPSLLINTNSPSSSFTSNFGGAFSGMVMVIRRRRRNECPESINAAEFANLSKVCADTQPMQVEETSAEGCTQLLWQV